MKNRVIIGTLLMAISGETSAQVLQVLGKQRELNAQPNIVFMLCDDMRYDRIAALNDWDPNLQTPHLDDLATDGMIFTRAYDTTPICSASRVVDGTSAPKGTSMGSRVVGEEAVGDRQHAGVLDGPAGIFRRAV